MADMNIIGSTDVGATTGFGTKGDKFLWFVFLPVYQDDRIYIFNVLDPTNPKLAHTLLSTRPNSLFVDLIGTRMYVTCYLSTYQYLEVWDISGVINGVAPELLGKAGAAWAHNKIHEPWGVVASDDNNYAFVCGRLYNALAIFDVSSPATLSSESCLDFITDNTHLSLARGILYFEDFLIVIGANYINYVTIDLTANVAGGEHILVIAESLASGGNWSIAPLSTTSTRKGNYKHLFVGTTTKVKVVECNPDAALGSKLTTLASYTTGYYMQWIWGNTKFFWSLTRSVSEDQLAKFRYYNGEVTLIESFHVDNHSELAECAHLIQIGEVFYLLGGTNNLFLAVSDRTLDMPDPPEIPVLYATPMITQIKLTWDVVKDGASYNIYWSDETGVTVDDGTLIEGVTQPYLFTPPQRDTYYYFIITSLNSWDEEGFPSDEVSERVITPYETCGELSVYDIYRNIAYRLNIAEDIHARTEQINFWSNDEILRAINEGYLDFVRRTRCLQKFICIGLVADTTTYDLPSDCIEVLWVGYGNENLGGKSLDYMDRLDDDWIGRAGKPTYYIQELGGVKELRLYETTETTGNATMAADDATGGGASTDTGVITSLQDASTYQTMNQETGIVLNITGDSVLSWGEINSGIAIDVEQHDDNLILLYAYSPPLFGSLEDVALPHVLSSYQWAIVYFALSELYLKEGDSQDLGQAMYYSTLYNDMVTNKIATQHIANIGKQVGQNTIKDMIPGKGPFLPLDAYPVN